MVIYSTLVLTNIWCWWQCRWWGRQPGTLCLSYSRSWAPSQSRRWSWWRTWRWRGLTRIRGWPSSPLTSAVLLTLIRHLRLSAELSAESEYFCIESVLALSAGRLQGEISNVFMIASSQDLTSVWWQGRKEILLELRPFPFLNRQELPVRNSDQCPPPRPTSGPREQSGGGVVVEVVTVQAVEAVDGHGAGVDVPVAGAGVGDLPVSLQPEPHPLPGFGLEK